MGRLAHRFLLALALLPDARAAAQAEIGGTFIQYLGVAANGVMINAAGHSMAYSESGAPPFSCDLYFPGSPVEEFTVEATGSARFVAFNSGPSGGAIGTTSGPTVSGNTIRWTGSFASGADAVSIDQTFTFNGGDRHVFLDVRITNTGSTALTDVYYLRSGDPDQGQCNIGFDFATNNDVVRQPPGDASALVVATGGTTPAVTFAMGAFDGRARAHTGGFNNTDASGTWNAPMDTGGASGDIAIAIAFREPSLAVGAATTFRIVYAWGPDPGTAAARFDAVACPSGATCDDGRFCTVTDRCGPTGCSGSSRDCSDAFACTSDACDEAADRCSSSITSGCLIAGSCRADGERNPSNACQLCNPGVTRTDWTSAAAGTSCDDGAYCTTGDSCNGSGVCSGGLRDCSDGLSCTTDICDEAGDRCVPMITAGCLIDGICISDGAIEPGNLCRICRASVSRSAWSGTDAGTPCGDPSCVDGVLTPSAQCDGSGMCVAGATMSCPGGVCADEFSCTGSCMDDGDCPLARFCATDGRCTPDLDGGMPCDRPGMCTTAFCVDGVCCDDGCDAPCVACDLSGARGTCSPHPEDTDPEGDCPDPAVCDGAGACFDPTPDAGPGSDGGSPDAARRDGGGGGGPGLEAHGSGLACAAGGGGGGGWILVLAFGLLARRRRRLP